VRNRGFRHGNEVELKPIQVTGVGGYGRGCGYAAGREVSDLGEA
jgi:hypothetical protein